jgi:putative FmdB family regulatory protein|tara:strand:- start:7121 stop:7345 length:225 start_codon:yes stop_codon:yes gene_type:complete
MPTYEYICSCGEKFTEVQRFNDAKLKKCDQKVLRCKGNGELTRLMGKPLIISDDIGRGTKKMKDKDLYKELDID